MSREGREGIVHVDRLGIGDVSQARETFALMASVFDETNEPLSDDYLSALLVRSEFWALAAMVGHVVVGGLTAHTLAMTNSQRSEVFLFDLAVDEHHQRKGVGRCLIQELVKQTRAIGIESVFLLADNVDTHALDFYRSIGATSSAVTMFDLGSHPST